MSTSNKHCSFEFSIYQRILKKKIKKKMYHGFHKILLSTLTIIINISHHISIRMFEGSCDTEDWNNDAVNSAFASQE